MNPVTKFQLSQQRKILYLEWIEESIIHQPYFEDFEC